MKRVGKAWYNPKAHGLIGVMRILYQDSVGPKKNQKALREEWHSDDWFLFFNLFWDAVKKKFGSTELWDHGSNLMIAVVLEQLQAVFLTFLSSTFERRPHLVATSAALARRRRQSNSGRNH